MSYGADCVSFLTKLIQTFEDCFKTLPTFYRKFKLKCGYPNFFQYFDIEYDFHRQGLFNKPQSDSNQNSLYESMIKNRVGNDQEQHVEKFHIINNLKENICDSYPPKVVVPKLITVNLLKEIASFRARNRFPILSYIFQNEHKEVYLWRSGQVKMGLFNNRSYQDEFFVDLMDNVTKHQVNITRVINSF